MVTSSCHIRLFTSSAARQRQGQGAQPWGPEPLLGKAAQQGTGTHGMHSARRSAAGHRAPTACTAHDASSRHLATQVEQVAPTCRRPQAPAAERRSGVPGRAAEQQSAAARLAHGARTARSTHPTSGHGGGTGPPHQPAPLLCTRPVKAGQQKWREIREAAISVKVLDAGQRQRQRLLRGLSLLSMSSLPLIASVVPSEGSPPWALHRPPCP